MVKGEPKLKNRNILISGAGIGGPALAYWLRCYGFNPTVVERAPALRDGGYAVDFRGTAMHVLERMGLLADVQQKKTNMGAVWFVNKANKRKWSLPSDAMSGEVEVLRGDLARIFYEATRQNIEYIFDDSITAITQSDDGVQVAFERSQPRTFDLVVGADGLHSNVRVLAFGEESRFIRHLGYYIAVFTTTNHLNLDHTGLYYNAPGKLAAIYSARHNTEAKASFYFASPPLDYDYRNTKQQKQIVEDTFAGLDWEVPRLLQAMWDSPDFYFDSISQIRMDRWSSGRVALLGDAGYCASPLSGMGTGLAVVGAYVLAGELKAADGDYDLAFARYEEQMREFAMQAQKFAEQGGNWLMPDTSFKMWMRDQSMRSLNYLPWKGLVMKIITEGALKVANSVTLKDYAGLPQLL
jgi:2-polyprenyl-6-methoxyphenol hydroxylase-like FAD-dependent oxidoreductase